MCTIAHEQDHIKFWERETCGACQDVPDGEPPQLRYLRGVPQDQLAAHADAFTMRMECSGFRAQVQCLKQNRAADPVNVDNEMYALMSYAASSYSCATAGWDK